jgi:hypothetical protein
MISIAVYLPMNTVPATFMAKSIITQQYDDLEFLDEAGVNRRFVGMTYSITSYPSTQQQLFGEK